MKIILNIISGILILFVLLFVLFPLSVIALPFRSAKTRLMITSPGWKIFFQTITYIACAAKVYSEDHRPEHIKKFHTPHGLYISNHQSFFDIPLSLSFYRIPPIMKKSILYIPIFGICGYSAGAMIVDRKDKRSRRKVFARACNRLLYGMKSLHFYPEGTRNKGDGSPKKIEELKKPIIKFAYANNIPLYTTTMYGTNKVFKGGLINHFQKVGIITRDAIYPKDFSDFDEFLEKAWGQVQSDYKFLEGKLTTGESIPSTTSESPSSSSS
jgi:1-acyl-sn-glycerol-3-phosphate acyltransferase